MFCAWICRILFYFTDLSIWTEVEKANIHFCVKNCKNRQIPCFFLKGTSGHIGRTISFFNMAGSWKKIVFSQTSSVKKLRRSSYPRKYEFQGYCLNRTSNWENSFYMFCAQICQILFYFTALLIWPEVEKTNVHFCVKNRKNRPIPCVFKVKICRVPTPKM